MTKKQELIEILVYAHWKGFAEPHLMGILKGTPSRGKEVFSFEHQKDWLETSFAQVLDPDLGFYAGPQYLNDGKKSNFGIFLDSSPDRWGRILMRRRESALARIEKRPETKLRETDYLLGVYDEHRMGGLRFKTSAEGNFQNDKRELASPPWTSLRELEFASLQLERDDVANGPDYLKWLNLLIAPGSSLGGARPKASVRDEKNELWIAKFPSRHDERDIGAWEMVVNELGRAAGINVAEGQIRKFTSRHNTFLTKRFDRTTKGERLHFASAMTMLGYNDGDSCEDGVSYIELVEFLSQNGARVNQDLEELWRRIVFYVCVSNTDDHLRNHGFIMTDRGWILSPAYDINPVSTGTGLKLNISENDNSLDLDVAREVIECFRIKKNRAEEIIKQVTKTVKSWKTIAGNLSISQRDMELMAPAFRAS